MKKWFITSVGSALLASSLFSASAFAENPAATLQQQVELLGDEEEELLSEEEPNNTFEAANHITAGELVKPTYVKGTLPVEDVDLYKVELDSDIPLYLYGLFWQETTNIPLEITLYDENKNTVEPNDLFVQEENGYVALYPSKPGTYFISVKNKSDLGVDKEYLLMVSQFYFHPNVERIYGADRYETALQVALKGWDSGSDEMILATGANYPDALAGAPLAYHRDAPILLTSKHTLHPSAQKGIEELDVKKVTILGGPGVISDNVVEEIKDLGVSVTRISGKDRYETAVAISKSLPNHDAAVVVSGKNYPDALSIASIAAQEGYPILLTEKDTIPASTLAQANTYKQNYVIGGTGVISQSVLTKLNHPTRISGVNRYETNASIIQKFNVHTGSVFFATGTQFADALTGSALAAHTGAPLLLTTPEGLHPAIKDLMIDYTYDVKILGGTKAIQPKVEKDIWAVLEDNQ
ncbi:cell wall-binding repeat-containing protein [Rossellomorea aquimaris]|uniref:cell wall-binding repeat-containing protein n=1 Tax=Rossellomorea aquimaris TaxID=189382 RepID=UPI000696BF9C|nr:cell wall-binding repeat-containing protein [Rossellomorea aquimaris]